MSVAESEGVPAAKPASDEVINKIFGKLIFGELIILDFNQNLNIN